MASFHRVAQLCAVCVKYDDGDLERRQLLLKDEVAVARNENVEVLLSLFQQSAVRQTAPTDFLD